MTIEIEIRHTMIVVVEGGCRYRTLMFADMSANRARQLAAEYGYTEEDIVDICHEALRYRRQVDDEQVWAVLDRLPYLERRKPEQMLAAVRSIVPQATKIEN